MLALLRIARFGLLACLALWASSTMLLAVSANATLPLSAVFFLINSLAGFALLPFALACVVPQAVVFLKRRLEERSTSVSP
ncbi:MAG: hypothetical protein J7494_11935 [Sphingobium sp.]|nr:hypothetical protein [Sphingobium sp.]